MSRIITLALALATFTQIASGGPFDWPQWQGPDRNAVSKERGLLQSWPPGGPPLAWRVGDLGGGFSAPSIADGRIFGMSNRGSDEVVWARSETNGKELWMTRIGPAYRGQGMPQGSEGPGSTPTVDGNRLYVVGDGGDLVCLKVEDGSIVWRKNFVTDFGGTVPNWAYRESPLVDGDKVICTPGGPDATLAALDKLTGKTIWKSQVPGSPGAAYSSIIAIDFEGQRQYVQLTAKTLLGVVASDGKFLWEYRKVANSYGINCSTPLYQNGLVFAASAYGAGGGLVKLSKDANGGIKADEVYLSKQMQNHHGGLVVIDGALYGGNGGNGTGYLVCLNFQTGEVLWNEGDPDKRRVPKGSIAVADGRIYYRTDTEAARAKDEMILIEPSRKEYIERGRFPVPDPSGVYSWSHPVIANGKLYIRDQSDLFCYDIKAK
jgi:outer membrane protein assembly factor BamB